MATAKGLTVEVGNSITISVQNIWVKGTVHSVEHYDDNGWYIELVDANVPGGYSYWKQIQDGGEIVEVNGTKVK